MPEKFIQRHAEQVGQNTLKHEFSFLSFFQFSLIHLHDYAREKLNLHVELRCFMFILSFYLIYFIYKEKGKEKPCNPWMLLY